MADKAMFDRIYETVVRLGGSSLPVLGVWNGLSICGKWMEVAYMKVINR